MLFSLLKSNLRDVLDNVNNGIINKVISSLGITIADINDAIITFSSNWKKNWIYVKRFKKMLVFTY